MLDELQAVPQVDVFLEERGPVEELAGDAEATFARIAEWHGVTLDPVLQRVLLRFEGMSSHWNLDSGDSFMFGGFSLCHLGAAMFATPSIESGVPGLDKELRVFDDLREAGNGSFAALRIQPGVTSPEVWFCIDGGTCFKLDLDYGAYLDALLVTKGVFGWQFLFADVDMRDDVFRYRCAPGLTEALKIFPEMFPGRDYEVLRARLAERLR